MTRLSEHARGTEPELYRDFAPLLVEWFRRVGRDYPWRRTTDPWAILVSEVMLQQTTIPTVLARYEGWMAQFPEPAALAAATEDEALRSWEGLGYYRRVRALRAAACAIVEKHGGCFPTAPAEIRALPGVGDYTVGAVLSFALNYPAPLVDANVARVFSRVLNDATPVDSPAGRRQQWEQAERLLHRTEPRAYNSALMELGQTICTATRPLCAQCPVRELCRARDREPERLPVKLPKKEVTAMEHHDIWLLTEQGLLLEKQTGRVRHEGMYRLPRRDPASLSGLELMTTQKYSVTRYKVTRRLYRAAPGTPAAEGEEFVPPAEVAGVPMASPDRKLVNRFLPGK